MTGVIVVGVDGSDTARKAAEAARDLALAFGAALHVVTAFEGDGSVVFGTGSDQRVVTPEEKAEKIAREAAVDLSSARVQVAYSAIRGTPAQALIDQAQKHTAQMIVVGNKRMQGIGRVLGSVANSVAHHAPCDVFIAKTDH
jgi:nucleotide-binding universal stress UspA family protein